MPLIIGLAVVAGFALLSRGTRVPGLDDAVGWFAAEVRDGQPSTPASLVVLVLVGALAWSFMPGKSKTAAKSKGKG